MLDNLFDKKFLSSLILSFINILILFLVLSKESRALDIFIQAIISSVGGITAALIIFKLESKRIINEKRRKKFNEHGNAVVQLEHELIPARINLANNINALSEILNDTTPSSIGLLLRTEKINISPGLSLKLQNLILINDYSKLFQKIKQINSDLFYLDEIVKTIVKKFDSQKIDESLLMVYLQLISHIISICEKTDTATLKLLSKCMLIIDSPNEFTLKEYIKTGKAINYNFDKDKLIKIEQKIIVEEAGQGEEPDKIFLPVYNLKRVEIKI